MKLGRASVCVCEDDDALPFFFIVREKVGWCAKVDARMRVVQKKTFATLWRYAEKEKLIRTQNAQHKDTQTKG